MSAAAPNKLLKLPDGPRTIAYRAFCQVLQADPNLLTLGVQFRTRSGAPIDAQEVATGECPVIALSPIPRDDLADTERTKRIVMEVSITLYVAGTCVDDILNLWDAVQAAIDLNAPYNGSTVYEFLRCRLPRLQNGDPVSIPDYRLTRPAFEPWLPSPGSGDAGPDRGSGMIFGEGRLSFNFPARR